MNQRALSTVLLRVFAVTYFFSALSGLTTQAIFFYGMYGKDNEGLGAADFTILAVFGLVLFASLAFSFVLLKWAAGLSSWFFKEDKPIISEGQIDLRYLLHVGIILVGAYLFINAFPKFIMSAIQWFKLQAVSTSDIYLTQANEAMIQSSIHMALIVFVLFRSRSISRFLSRSSN